MLAATLLAWPAAAQLVTEVDTAEPASFTDALPEYQIEIIVFAYRDFNAGEEDFAHERERAAPDGLAAAPNASSILEAAGLDPGWRTLPEPVTLLDPLAPAQMSTQDGVLDTTGGIIGAGSDATQQTTAPQPFHFRPLAPEEFALNGEYASLSRLSAYVPLLHGGWVQPAYPQEEAHAFDLALLGATNPRGSIELYVSRFLHVTLDLSYQAPAATGAQYDWQSGDAYGLGEFGLAPRYPLHVERRLRSGELHYFDHPAFGVLLQIRPQPVSAPVEAPQLPLP
jgi:Peptidoglycan-binding protein, CsiV